MNLPSAPFVSSKSLTIVLPTRLDKLDEAEQRSLQNIPAIFEENRAALERELGAPFELRQDDPGTGARWLIGPARCNPALARLGPPGLTEPALFLDRANQLLVSDAVSAEGIWETFSLLRSLARFAGGTLKVADCGNLDEAIKRIVEEVGDCYPAFELRGLEWEALCEKHIEKVKAAADPNAAMQEWLAELQDTHTWIRPASPQGYLPYEAWVTEQDAVLLEVPPGSAAWEAGIRPGFRMVEENTAGWWRRTAATPHARPLVAGRRLLMGEFGTERELWAAGPDGRRIGWTETIRAEWWQPLMTWKILPSGAGYLKIRAWAKAEELEAQIDAALADFKKLDKLIVDLRGNGGGDLAIALRFRDRFLREAGTLGTIRYSVSHKMLSEPDPIYGEPAPAQKRWPGKVRFLTDPLTYSASEDAMLGLQGLAHVQIFGEPSGGGSGRLRWLRLLPGWRLTISTALTYDRNGHCIEGQGIPVDQPVKSERFSAAGQDAVLYEAERGW